VLVTLQVIETVAHFGVVLVNFMLGLTNIMLDIIVLQLSWFFFAFELSQLLVLKTLNIVLVKSHR
jgi:hypothetical protein